MIMTRFYNGDITELAEPEAETSPAAAEVRFIPETGKHRGRELRGVVLERKDGRVRIHAPCTCCDRDEKTWKETSICILR